MSNEKCKEASQKKSELPDTRELYVPHPSHLEIQMDKQEFNKQHEDATKINKKADAWLENYFDKGNAPKVVDDNRVNGGGGGGGRGNRGNTHREIIDRADRRGS